METAILAVVGLIAVLAIGLVALGSGVISAGPDAEDEAGGSSVSTPRTGFLPFLGRRGGLFGTGFNPFPRNQ